MRRLARLQPAGSRRRRRATAELLDTSWGVRGWTERHEDDEGHGDDGSARVVSSKRGESSRGRRGKQWLGLVQGLRGVGARPYPPSPAEDARVAVSGRPVRARRRGAMATAPWGAGKKKEGVGWAGCTVALRPVCISVSFSSFSFSLFCFFFQPLFAFILASKWILVNVKLDT